VVHRPLLAAAGYGEISLIVQTLQATNLHILHVERGRVEGDGFADHWFMPSPLYLRDFPDESTIVITIVIVPSFGRSLITIHIEPQTHLIAIADGQSKDGFADHCFMPSPQGFSR